MNNYILTPSRDLSFIHDKDTNEYVKMHDILNSLKENNMELIDDMSRDTTDFPVLVLSLYKIGAEYFYSDSTIYPKLGRNDYRKRFQQEYSLVPLRNYEIANLLSEKRASILYDYINFALKKIGFDC